MMLVEQVIIGLMGSITMVISTRIRYWRRLGRQLRSAIHCSAFLLLTLWGVVQDQELDLGLLDVIVCFIYILIKYWLITILRCLGSLHPSFHPKKMML